MIRRFITPSNKRSFFVFGARGTGKSTYTRDEFLPSVKNDALYLDLLDPETEAEFARRPLLLEERLAALKKPVAWVVLDEVQRVPKLLDVVHRLIEARRVRFILTGSSTRKLKRGAANLLAGRAFVYRLFPFTARELGPRFDLELALHWGTLPEIWNLETEEDRRSYLRSYGLTYLKEEIQSEQLLRRLDPFRLFLEIAAQMNGKILNHNRIAREVGVDSKTVRSYFEILEDTWVGFHLAAFHRSVRKAQAQHAKFYFFDPGVTRALARSLDSRLAPATSAFGEAFEHWVILEFHRMNEYRETDYRLSYLRTKEGAEIDLILSRGAKTQFLIEIKSAERADELEAGKLERWLKDFPGARALYLSRDRTAKRIGKVECLPWQAGLDEVFG